jgi:hypothetical protein
MLGWEDQEGAARAVIGGMLGVVIDARTTATPARRGRETTSFKKWSWTFGDEYVGTELASFAGIAHRPDSLGV